MSMMDTLNAPQPPQDQQGQQPPGPTPSPGGQTETFARLQGGDLEGQFNKAMMLTSQQLWQNGMAELVNEQLLQDDSDPSAVIGKFVAFLMSGVNAAYNSKQQAPEPIVMCGVAEQMADQITDIALNNETVAPGDADDTAEAGALIGIQLFLEQFGNQVGADDQAEYKKILQQLIQNAPGAAEIAADEMDDAQEMPDVEAMMSGGAAPTGGLPPDQQGAQPQQQAPAQGGMAAALGGQ